MIRNSCLALAIACASAPIYSAEVGDWQVNFFASQTIHHTDDNNFLGETEDDVSFDNSEVGLGIIAPAWHGFHGAAQLLSRRAGENDNGRLRLDYLYGAYDVVSSLDNTLKLKVGRMPYPDGMYNDTRDVAFTRTSIFMPQSVYQDRIRNSHFYQDGIELSWRHFIGYDQIYFLTQYGVLPIDDEEAQDFSPGNFIRKLDAEPGWLGRVEYSVDEGVIRIALGAGRYDFEYESQSVDGMLEGGGSIFAFLPPEGDIETRFWFASAEFNTEKWSFVLEYNPLDFKFDIPGIEIKTLGYYGQAQYRINAEWSVLARYDVYYLNRDDKDGDFLTASGIPIEINDAKDTTLGVTWAPNYNWLVRAEWHSVQGLGWVTARDNPNLLAATPDAKIEKNWNLVALQIAFRY